MGNTKTKTVKQLLQEIGSYSYDNGDFNVIKDTNKEKEVADFVRDYLQGCEIISNGQNGGNVTIKGAIDKKGNATGEEELFCHDYLLYDLTGHTGDWQIVTFKDVKELEKHIISEGGYLNIFCTEMIVFKDGVIKPFDILFTGNNDMEIVIDKDQIDETFDIAKMKEKLSVFWK